MEINDEKIASGSEINDEKMQGGREKDMTSKGFPLPVRNLSIAS